MSNKPKAPEIVDDDLDPNFKKVIQRAWETGNIVRGEYDDDGKFTMTEVDLGLKKEGFNVPRKG